MRTAEVNAALRARFCAPEWAIFFEVGDATGANQRRWADAVAMNLYPSRGLELHGFEVKVSRSDWTKELKSPDKSGPVQQYCDRWWVVCPAGVIKEGELPPTWGHYEVSPGGKIRQVVAAPKLTPVEVTRGFVASFLRRASGASDDEISALVEKRLASYRESDKRHVESEITYRTRQFEDLQKQVKEFEAASGLSISSRWEGGQQLGNAVKLVMKSGIQQTYGGIAGIRNSMQKSLDIIDKAMAECNVETEADNG
jgi:hypothetical protein